MGFRMLEDLASLIAPISEQSFLEHFLEKKRLYIKCDDRTRTLPLLPWTTINQLIQSNTLPPDRFRVIRANTDILPSMFRYREGAQGLRVRALQALLPQGVSLIINGIGDLVPEIGRLADAIERRLTHRTWVNAYLSFGKGSAFKAHWDHHDVLVLQVHGSKRWRSYGTPMQFPIEKYGPSGPFGSEILWQGLLEPGDALYLPRGEVHDAVLEAPRSVHLTIGVQAQTGIDLLGQLLEKAATDALPRMDLTRLAGDTALREHEGRLKQSLHALVDSINVGAFLAAEDERRKLRPLFNTGLGDEFAARDRLVPTLRR